MLSCDFCEISKNTFFTEHLWATASEICNWVERGSFQTIYAAVNLFSSFKDFYRNSAKSKVYTVVVIRLWLIFFVEYLFTKNVLRQLTKFKYSQAILDVVARTFSIKNLSGHFLVKLQTRVCNFIVKTSLLLVFFREFFEIFQKSYYVEICEQMFLHSNRNERALLGGWFSDR